MSKGVLTLYLPQSNFKKKALNTPAHEDLLPTIHSKETEQKVLSHEGFQDKGTLRGLSVQQSR